MASVLATTFAAFAFAGAGEVMKYIDPSNSADELARHDLANEEANKAAEAFSEQQVLWKRAKEEKASRRRDEDQALGEISRSTDQYRKAFDKANKGFVFTYNGRKFTRKPRASDFYKPSKKYVTSGLIFVGAVGAVSGVAVISAYKLISGRDKKSK